MKTICFLNAIVVVLWWLVGGSGGWGPFRNWNMTSRNGLEGCSWRVMRRLCPCSIIFSCCRKACRIIFFTFVICSCPSINKLFAGILLGLRIHLINFSGIGERFFLIMAVCLVFKLFFTLFIHQKDSFQIYSPFLCNL